MTQSEPTTKPLRLRDGKFYRGDEEVPLEFGNKEQIALIKKAEQYAEWLSGDGLEVDPEITYRATVDIECICGDQVYFSEVEHEEYEQSAIDGLLGDEATCRSCKREYVITGDGVGYLIVKLKK